MSMQRIFWPVHVISFIIGLVISASLLSGDALGRVNLLYLLLLYFAIPVFGAVLSIYSLVFNGKLHLAQWCARLGLLKLAQQPYFQALRKSNLDRMWLLQQSQIMAVSFAASSVFVLLMMLLFSDISFVWRSTILTPEHIYTLLSTVASPWAFWAQAQPDLELLRATQDFRLAASSVDYLQTGQWWLFILATQLFYSLMLRGIIFTVIQLNINRAFKTQNTTTKSFEPAQNKSTEKITQRPETFNAGHMQGEIIIWDIIPKVIQNSLFQDITQIGISHWQGTGEQQNLLANANKPLVVVKGWEPPMGELGDALALNVGFILAISWQGEKLRALNQVQQLEWIRFAQENNWQLLLTEELSEDV